MGRTQEEFDEEIGQIKDSVVSIHNAARTVVRYLEQQQVEMTNLKAQLTAEAADDIDTSALDGVTENLVQAAAQLEAALKPIVPGDNEPVDPVVNAAEAATDEASDPHPNPLPEGEGTGSGEEPDTEGAGDAPATDAPAEDPAIHDTQS